MGTDCKDTASCGLQPELCLKIAFIDDTRNRIVENHFGWALNDCDWVVRCCCCWLERRMRTAAGNCRRSHPVECLERCQCLLNRTQWKLQFRTCIFTGVLDFPTGRRGIFPFDHDHFVGIILQLCLHFHPFAFRKQSNWKNTSIEENELRELNGDENGNEEPKE